MTVGELGPATLGDVARDGARRYGNRPAVIHGDRRLSYAQLEHASAALGARLLGDGLGRGGHVGILLPNGVDFVVTLFAVTRVGGVAAPLSTLSQAPELRWLLDHGDMQILVTTDRFRNHDYLARLEEALPGLSAASPGALRLIGAPRLRAVHCTEAGRRPWTGSAPGTDSVSDDLREAIERTVTADDPAVIIHTSGTTADPKGVVHRHGAVAGHSWRMAQQYWLPGTGDVLWSPRPWFWVAGLVADLLYTLQAGATLVVPTSEDPGEVLDMVQRERITYLGGPLGTVLHISRSDAFADAGLTAVPVSIDAAGLAHTTGGLRFVSQELEERLPAARASTVPIDRLPNLFGMSETLGTHSGQPHGSQMPEGAEGVSGPPVPGMEVRLTHLETGEPVAPDNDGLLWVRGESLMVGLHRRPRSDVFDPDGWYSTGDVCQIDERGWIRFRSRLGDVVKIGGANVAPLEVERVLAARPDIDDVAVIGTTVPGTPTLVAVVVPSQGVGLDHDELRQWAKERLSSYKVPRIVVEIGPEEMPRTASGKVRKEELRKLVDGRLAAR